MVIAGPFLSKREVSFLLLREILRDVRFLDQMIELHKNLCYRMESHLSVMGFFTIKCFGVSYILM